LRRVGGNGEVAVNVRVVALTLRDLRNEARRSLFRLDLYHRLAGCELHLPALRERPSDVPLLAAHFLAELAAEIGERSIDTEALALLRAYDWPGNVRELRNVLRRAIALSDGTIHREDLALDTCTSFPCASEAWRSSRAADAPEPGTATASVAASADVLMLAGKSFEEMQNAIFRWALQRNDGSRRRAAQALGVSRSTFCDRVRRLGLGMSSPVQ
jgi:DNA-binding NtrC family response regulator